VVTMATISLVFPSKNFGEPESPKQSPPRSVAFEFMFSQSQNRSSAMNGDCETLRTPSNVKPGCPRSVASTP